MIRRLLRHWRSRKSLSRRAPLGVEPLDRRLVLSASPLVVGAVYTEQDAGSDLHADTFEVAFVGGAPGTTLDQLVIDGDQGDPGLGRGDTIFDTAPGGLGADGSSPFQVVTFETADPLATVSATVVDGGTRLVLDLQRFQAGDRLVFSIDVDEIEFWPGPTAPLDQQNDGIDPVTSGIEFHGSLLQASFSAPHYEPASGSTTFVNRYDDVFAGSNLPLPADDEGGKRDRTAGGRIDLQQQVRPASLRGVVYHDRNRDGTREPGEEGISGVPVRLIPVDTVEPQAELTVTTDAEGRYAFDGIMPGTYRAVEVAQPAPYLDGQESVGTVDGTRSGNIAAGGDAFENIDLPGGSAGRDYNFGEYLASSIRGTVYLAGHDGDCATSSTTRSPLAGVRVELFDGDGNLVATTSTGDDGKFEFTDLAPGEYRVVEYTPDGLIDGSERPGIIVGSGQSIVLDDDVVGAMLDSGDELVDVEFCELPTSSIRGFVYHDRNDDGMRQPATEEPIPEVRITLVSDTGLTLETRTNPDGSFEFTGLPGGTYRLTEEQPAGWIDGKDGLGTIGGTPVGVLANDDVSHIVLPWGVDAVDYNFGELLPASIAGHVFVDRNDDCVRDADESPIAGVTVELYDEADRLVATTQTDADGGYIFTGLRPGTYRVHELQPDGFFHGGQEAGSGGGDASQPDLITDITVGSGDALVDYDFCEIPPAEISGYVYRDGAPIQTLDGRPPADLASVRNGLRTPDDTPLAGVVLELRHGVTGEALDATWALPGRYPPGPITTVTDADGFYRFDGLPPGIYAVYEKQPAGLFDGIDHPGTLSGVAINPNDADSLTVLTTLTVEPNNDAIVRIAVPAGGNSQENNFSEVLVQRPPILPPPPPRPPQPPRPPEQPPLFNVNYVLPPIVGTNRLPYDFRPVHRGGGAAGTYTWHLSVINGGAPRTEGLVTISRSLWHSVSWIEPWQGAAQRVEQGTWHTVATVVSSGDVTTEGPTTVEHWLLGHPDAIPVAGDFNGDGVSEVGVYIDGEWFIDLNGNGRWDPDDLWAQLGSKRDLPVVGDWDGDGKDDIGIYGPQWRRDWIAIRRDPGIPDAMNDRRPKFKNVPPAPAEATDGLRLMRRSMHGPKTAHLIDHVFAYGRSSAVPISGDFDGDGIDTIGTFHNGEWRLDQDGDGRQSNGDRVLELGRPGDRPIVGDFNGDGIDELGVYRNGTWMIDMNRNGRFDEVDRVFELGGPDDIPVVADVDGDGIDDPLIYQAADRDASSGEGGASQVNK